MTERAYITVDRAESPRLVEVAKPGSGGSDEVTLQDLHDTLNSNTLPAGDPDDSLDNMDDDYLIDSAGKEDLGGGVQVGITSTLQNAQIAFQGNYVPSQTGTATSADALGKTLTDTAATFVTNGIKRGDWIVNFSDKSVTEVLRVLSETELQHRTLQSGVQNDWGIGDDYAIFAVIQKEVAGGNIVAVAEDGVTNINTIFPTFATQVVRTSSSSATLQEQADIQYASFGGGVTIDLTGPYSGTTFPNGTPRQPVNNIADAVAIAQARGFTALYIIGDATFDSAVPSLRNFSIIGESPNKSSFVVDPAADVENSEFSSATIQGTLDGGNVVADCVINDLNFVDGIVAQCVLNGTVTLSTQQDAHFLDCWSGVPGLATPTINCGGSGSGLAMRNYNGGITLTNKSGPESVSIDMNSGQVVLDDTVTTGTIVMRGIGTWTNELTYAGGADIVNQLINPQDAQAAAFNNEVTIDITSPYSGTVYPVGTARMPVNNLADAKTIAVRQGFNKLHVQGSFFFAPGDDISNYRVYGQNASQSMISINAGTLVQNTEFGECLLTGDVSQGDNIIVRNAILSALTGFEGIAFQCLILNDLTCRDDNASRVALLDCYSGNPDEPHPVVHLRQAQFIARNFSGGLQITDKTGNAAASIDMSGTVSVADTVASGTLILRGVGTWYDKDTYAGTATVIDELLNVENSLAGLDANLYDGKTFKEIQEIMLAMAQGRIRETAAGSKVFEVYAQNNTTILYTLSKSGTERNRV
jgi:hypothetical protein